MTGFKANFETEANLNGWQDPEKAQKVFKLKPSQKTEYFALTSVLA